jgi:RNA polymerase sigma factor (sigma-70 family)
MVTDAELLANYATTGSDQAFEEIVRRYMNPVFGVCMRILGDPAAAEDASQATFIVLMRKAGRLPRNVILSSWLMQTARFAAQDACKMQKRRTLHERTTQHATTRVQVESDLLRDEINRYLDAALNSLPREQRDTIVLRFLCERTEEEVARELKCPRSTISTRVRAGLNRLRAKMTSSGITVPSVVLTAYLQDQALAVAPATLRGIIFAAGKSQSGATAAALKIADGTGKTLMWMQAKAVASVALFVLAAGGVGVVGWNALSKSRIVPVPQKSPAAQQKSDTAVPRKPPVDFANLRADTWVNLDFSVESTAGVSDGVTATWQSSSTNRLVYDAHSKCVLFFDRWHDPETDTPSDYGNCLFSFDPQSGHVRPINVVNWKTVTQADTSIRTVPAARNSNVPSPCPRYVFNGFDYSPELNALFLTNGANASAMRDGVVVGHKECENTWRLDLAENKWTMMKSTAHPTNFPLGASVVYSANAKKLVYCNYGEIWIMEPEAGEWHKSKAVLPDRLYGQTICDDPRRERMLLVGGAKNISQIDERTANTLYAFDPINETITRLSDAPAPLYMAHLAYDSTRDVFVAAPFKANAKSFDGVIVYNPKKEAWSKILTRNQTPQSGKKTGTVALCFDSALDCFIAFVPNSLAGADSFYAFRHLPAK